MQTNFERMKKIVFGALAFVALNACKKEPTIPAPTPEKEITMETPGIQECYQGILKKDTMLLSLTIKGNEVTDGKLSYKFFEKDKNDGTFTGKTSGDTLFAEYTFNSEGQKSVREVAFLKKGDSYIEGFGDMEEKNGKMQFKDKKKLFFDGKTVLDKIPCN